MCNTCTALVTYMYRYTYSGHHVYLIACHRVYGNTMIRGDSVERFRVMKASGDGQ